MKEEGTIKNITLHHNGFCPMKWWKMSLKLVLPLTVDYFSLAKQWRHWRLKICKAPFPYKGEGKGL